MSTFVNRFTQGGHSRQLPLYQRGAEFGGRKMSLNSKRLSLADMRLKISETEADLEAQFRELRERLRQAEFQRICKTKRGLESPRQLSSPQSPGVCG